MRLYTYTLRVDDGAAPNPYGGVCTLTICKPVIRRTADIGDWVVGLGPKRAPGNHDLSNHVIYAMCVSDVLSLEDYDAHCRECLPSKIPDWHPDAPFEHQVGDCIYYPRGHGLAQRRGVHNKGNEKVDHDGVNALLADRVFFYFGQRAVELPKNLEAIMHNTQGHKVNANEALKDRFVEWALGGFGRGLHPRILYGDPLHKHLVRPGREKATWSACGKRRIVSEQDEICSIC
ncbi:hypothetical protein [Variovorax boronicumulans]|uniref:Nmad2 family putative nucleotide modification protein n=1 Tax=Variovorax boronicumulans TaxID=436515 RepID=UPI0012FD5412|nr:hypothetical protein [Variovorax boronicumulans]